MNVTVLLPWRAGCPYRERSRAVVRERLRVLHPEWRIVDAETDDDPFIKARAILLHATDDLLVVHDTDALSDGLDAAVAAVRAGASWAVPHQKVHRLSEVGTERFIADGCPVARAHDYESTERHRGVLGGGIVVLEPGLIATHPPDVRFVGWGGEDAAWGRVLGLAGQPWRVGAPLVHLWHPPAPRQTRAMPERAESRRLMLRYLDARGAALEALRREALEAWASHETPAYGPSFRNN